MDKKRNWILGLTLGLFLPLVSCGGPKETSTTSSERSETTSTSISSSSEPETLTPEAQSFVDYVYSIQLGENTLRDIDIAYDLFDALDDASWNFDEVLNAYAYLEALEALYQQYNLARLFVTGAEEISYLSTADDLLTINGLLNLYDELDETGRNFVDVEYQHERLIRIKASIESEDDARKAEERELAILQFLSVMGNVPGPDEITLDDEGKLNSAKSLYESLDSKCKEDERVIEAYSRLNAAIEAFEDLRNDPSKQESAVIRRFLYLVGSLPSLEEMEVADYPDVIEAKKTYDGLSDESKSSAEVSEAYAALCAAEERFRALYLEYLGTIEAQDFLSAVNGLGEKEELRESDLPSLLALRSEYEALSGSTKNTASCKEAINKIEAYIQYLHQQFAYTKIPVNITSVAFTANATPRLQISAPTNVLSQLKTIYGVDSNAALQSKVAVYLCFYDAAGNELLFWANVSSTYLASGSSYITSIPDFLVEASRYDPNIVSGDYRVGLRFLDLTATYADADAIITATSAHYDFESAYGQASEEDDGYVMIHNAAEFLAISDNLSGNYRLANDIDLSGIQWTNLGEFKGNLDGAGHYLINVTQDNGQDAKFSVFEPLASGASVKRLGMRGKVTESGGWAGSIAVNNYGLIQDCHIDLDISSVGNIGGIVCNNRGTINHCLVTSVINGNTGMTGGIAVGEYGTCTNSFFWKDRVNTQKAVGNSNSDAETAKNETELKSSSLYAGFDPFTWVIVDGVIPTLFSK